LPILPRAGRLGDAADLVDRGSEGGDEVSLGSVGEFIGIVEDLDGEGAA
jgi:hypothetical protein